MRRSTFGAAFQSWSSVGARGRARPIIPARSPDPAWRLGGSEDQHGVGEIRTHEGLSPLAVFKTAAFNRSATTPGGYNVFPHNRLFRDTWSDLKPPGRQRGRIRGCPAPNSRQKHPRPDQLSPTLLLLGNGH